MAGWAEILNEINTSGSTHDIIRRKYLKALSDLTGRNTIAYYSGWLQKPRTAGVELNDADKNGFMNAIHKLDKARGLDLVLHTPGGDTSAMESLVEYIRSIFGTNMRAIVPQLAMSAGTMIACSCKKIVMGKHSSLGPVDPQIGGIPAHGVIEEFKRAYEEISADQHKAFVWQPIISKYTPTLIGECEKSIKWCNEMVQEWLITGMFDGQADAKAKAATIVAELADHALSMSHARHFSYDRCHTMGLDVDALEDDHKLQDAVLSVHHAFIHTLSHTAAYKIIENQDGIAFIQIHAQVLVQNPSGLAAE